MEYEAHVAPFRVTKEAQWFQYNLYEMAQIEFNKAIKRGDVEALPLPKEVHWTAKDDQATTHFVVFVGLQPGIYEDWYVSSLFEP